MVANGNFQIRGALPAAAEQWARGERPTAPLLGTLVASLLGAPSAQAFGVTDALMAILTVQAIRRTKSDSALLKKLFKELEANIPAALHKDLDELVGKIEHLPRGLRAMAATYQLDVSMTLDDLGWHFANWHHHGYCRETSLGLRELEAGEMSEIFDRAYSITSHHWEIITRLLAQGFDVFLKWYRTSELEATLAPLNQRLRVLLKEASPGGESGIFRYWLAYARKYPHQVVS